MTPLCVCGHYGDVHLGTELPPGEGWVPPASAVQMFAPFTCQMCDCSDFKAKSR